MSFQIVKQFEQEIAKFFGAPYAVAVDSCTHGIELCLRYTKSVGVDIPKHTYISVPFTASKLGIALKWRDENWRDYYMVDDRVRPIYDAAVYWKKNGYVPNSFMCVSFQYQKHLSLGRGGIILCDNEQDAIELKKMSYDGRSPDLPWREQDISTFGYHYYMTPETAQLGLDKLEEAIETPPRQWTINDWPDLTQMSIFKFMEVDPYLQTR